MDAAASRDDTRRTEFEHCRAQGRTNCDAILNAPVNSNTPRGDAVRDQEARAAYDRCVARGGSDCDNLLHRWDYATAAEIGPAPNRAHWVFRVSAPNPF